ncbi:oligosaccharide flippase family protein [Methylotenera mobilis]|uniref:oligosaccharide flippase family protein n=1 Tax=Methylotenera mobilis TaxID=359408 RepID=UPI00037971C2|nr:oligosaccharide flippase family protein [Methylotenera mobilis]
MIQRFFKDVVIYALPMFLARAAGLLLLPIYTRQLGPADFGFVEFIAATSTILLLVLPLEINQAVGRLLPEAENDRRKYKIITTALWFTLAVFGSFGVLVYLSRFQWLEILNLSSSYAQYTALICFHFLILAIVNLLQVKFRFTSQAKYSVTINMAIVVSNLALVLYFTSVNRLGVEQYFLSQILSGVVGILIGLGVLIKQYRTLPLFKNIDVQVLRELLKYSLPLVLSSIGVALTASIDRLMIGSNIGLVELGYYGAAVRLSTIVSLGFYVISSAMTPMVYGEHEKPETRVLIAKVFQITGYSSIALLIIVTFYSELIITLFAGVQFTAASKYLFYLMLSAVIAGSYMFFLGMDIYKKTTILSKINIISGVLGSVMCVALVPVFGVWGAIASTLLSNSLRISGYVFFSQRLYKVPVFLWHFSLAIIFLIIINILLKT